MNHKFLLLTLLTVSTTLAQVGIGTTNPKATLHIVSEGSSPDNEKGVIIPKVSTLVTSTTSAPVETGLIVYYDGTDPSTTLPEGMYLFKGEWQIVSTSTQENFIISNGELFVNDSTRGKFLSAGVSTIIYSDQSRDISDRYLLSSGKASGGDDDEAGYLLPFDCTVVYISVYSTDSDPNAQVHLRKISDDSDTTLAEYQLTDGSLIDHDQDIDLEAGDVLQLYVARDANLNHPQVFVGIKRRL
tara:strand:+ start:1268 stop:1996 length:729 start_codon:yes stop_codon:yes gene_type:complete